MIQDPLQAEIANARRQAAALEAKCGTLPLEQRGLVEDLLASFSSTLDRLQVAGETLRHREESGTGAPGNVTLAATGPQGELLEHLVESAPVGIAVLRGAEHRYALANPYYRAMTGAPDRAIIGRTVVEAIPDLPSRGMPPLLDEVYRTGETVSTREVQLRIGPGREETYWNTDRVPLHGSGGGVEAILVLAHDVTHEVLARKRIEALSAQAQQNADEMAAVFAALVGPTLLLDAAGEIIQANPAAVAAMGFDPTGLTEELLARKLNVQRLDGTPIPPDERVGLRALRGELVRDAQAKLLRVQGEERAILVSAAPIATSGCITGAVVTWHDVTGLKRAEEALRESEEKLRALFEFLPVGLAVLDRERHILAQNPALASILDLPNDYSTRGVYRSRRYLRADGSEMTPDEFPSLVAFREQREARNVEIGVIKEDGERVWTSVSAAPLPFPDWRTVVVTVDITQQKQVEEALRHERDFNQAVLNTSGGLVVVLDLDGRIVRVNPAWESVTGYAFDKVKGQRFWDFFATPDEQASVTAVFADLLAHRSTNENESRLHARDGSRRWIRWSNTALCGEDGAVSYIISTGIDITGHRETEEQLAAALEESRERQREIAALLAGARLILRQHTFNDSARSIFESCKNLIGAQAGYVALCSSDRSENEVVYLDPGNLSCTVDPALPMPIRGLRGRAYATGKATYENRFQATPFVELLPPGHVGVENVLFAPLSLGDEVVGLLGLANKPGGFDEHDVRIAEAFGELAAIALQNSRLTESLEASEKRFRAILETANAAIITADSWGRIASWNRMAEEMFGYTELEMVGTSLLRVIPERFQKAHQDGMRRALAAGATRRAGDTVESVGARKDSSEFPLEMSLATWHSAEGSSFSAILHDISERKRVQEELRQANQSIQAVIRASPLAIITLDADLNVWMWNPAAERIFGWSEHELLGRPYPLVPVSRQEEYHALLEQLWQGQPLSGYETQRQRRDGELLDVSLWTSPLYDTEGRFGGLLAILNDITQRKQAEADLQRYADEQAALYAIGSAVSVTLDLDRLLTNIFDAVFPLLGADAGWILLPGPRTDSFPRIVASRDAAGNLSDADATRPLRDCPIYASSIADGGYGVEPRLVTDCPVFPAHSSDGLDRCVCVPLSVGGTILGVLKLGWLHAHPETERENRLLAAIGRQLSMALHNAQLYQAARQLNRLTVLAALDEAVAATLDPRKVAEETLQHVAAGLDAMGLMLLLPRPADTTARQQVYAVITGWRTAEIPPERATSWQEVVQRFAHGADSLPLSAEELSEIHPNSDLARYWGPHGMVIAVRAKKQLKAVLALGGRPGDRPFSDEDRALALVAASHAGQAIQNAQLYEALKEMLTERDQTRAQLVQSEKLSALGRLVASLTHEINNPLQSVQGCLSLLGEELKAEQRPEKMDRYLLVVQEEIERIATIVRRMREFSRPAREQLSYVDLRVVVESVLDLSSKQLQHSRVEVLRNWGQELPLIEANPDHLKQVFLNLVLNAIDAMPDGGALRISIAEDLMPPSGDQPLCAAVRIDFSDTGEGMSPAVLSRLFEPFFTTRPHGAGLGLPISYGIVRGQHGDIVVTSEEGAGSTLSIYLPIAQP